MEKEQLQKIIQSLDQMSEMIDELRSSLPEGDPADIEEATDEGEAPSEESKKLLPAAETSVSDDSHDNDMQKSMAVAMLRKHLG